MYALHNRALVVWLSLGCVYGTLIEEWNLLDSLYFSVTALSTGGLKAPSDKDLNLWFTGMYVHCSLIWIYIARERDRDDDDLHPCVTLYSERERGRH